MAFTDLDEQLLVRAHQAGDEHAFGQIVRSQHRALYAHAYRRLGNHEAAEDAVQDTLLRAYRALPSFDGDLRLRAWLHRILTNVCHDESNRRKRASGLIDRLEAEPILLAPDPIEETVLHDTVRIMNDALAELPENYREALVLRYVDGLSFREVAEITGVTEENARARVHRGRAALHKVLSRVAVVLAFLVPGLRRAHAPSAEGAAVATAEPTVSLATQLTSHAMYVAPQLTRVAEVATATSGAKSSMVATAVAAAAAIAAPVAAYGVYDATKTPERPPAAVAAPADDEPEISTSASPEVAAADGTTTSSSTPATTTTTLPASAAAPFVGVAPDAAEPKDEATTTTSAAPPTTTPPAAEPTTEPTTEPAMMVEGTIGGDAFEVIGGRPDFDVSGRAILDGSGDPVAGVLQGRVYVADAVGGEAITELTFTLDDGRQLRVRFRGILDGEQAADGVTTWTMSGQYRIQGGEAVGVADAGSASVTFRIFEGAPSALTFDLFSQQAADS